MTENQQPETPKKMSLQEAAKLKLEAKKNQASNGKAKANSDLSGKKMKSQQAKKTTTTRRKMGV